MTVAALFGLWIILGIVEARFLIPLMEAEAMDVGGPDQLMWRGFTIMVLVVFAPFIAVMAAGCAVCWVIGKVGTR